MAINPTPRSRIIGDSWSCKGPIPSDLSEGHDLNSGVFDGADFIAPPSGRARHRNPAPQQYYQSKNARDRMIVHYSGRHHYCKIRVRTIGACAQSELFRAHWCCVHPSLTYEGLRNIAYEFTCTTKITTFTRLKRLSSHSSRQTFVALPHTL